MINMKNSGNRLIFWGILFLVPVLLITLIGPYMSDKDPYTYNSDIRFLKPSSEYYFGTDQFGRDIFTRVAYGGRITLPISFVTMFLTSILGLFLGIVSALNIGRLIDTIIMRIVDVLIAIPFTVIAMAITSIFGRGLYKILYLVVFFWWAPFARYARSLVLSMKNREAVMSAKILGASNIEIVFREILPNIFSLYIIYFIFELASLITSIATLSFFGLGAQPPTPEWGSMLSDGRTYYLYSIHILLWPSLFIVFTITGLNLIGEGIRDKYSPYEIIEVGD